MMPLTQKNLSISPFFVFALVAIPVILVAVVLFSVKTPSVQFVAPGVVADTPTATPTIIPFDIPLIPPYTPAYPCELQNQTVLYDAKDNDGNSICRSERIEEQVLAEGDGVLFVKRSEHTGSGCWTGVNVDVYKLKVCNPQTGAITTIGQSLISPLQVSPDGSRYAYAVLKPIAEGGDGITADVYIVDANGDNVQQLDTQGFPEQRFGATYLRWSDDGAWLEFELWDGTQPDGWQPYRLKADGSGLLEELPYRVMTYTPEPSSTWVESPTPMTGFTPDPFAPFPSPTPAPLPTH